MHSNININLYYQNAGKCYIIYKIQVLDNENNVYIVETAGKLA